MTDRLLLFFSGSSSWSPLLTSRVNLKGMYRRMCQNVGTLPPVRRHVKEIFFSLFLRSRYVPK